MAPAPTLFSLLLTPMLASLMPYTAASSSPCVSPSCATPGACPASNPVSTFFPPSRFKSYSWSNASLICWSCVYSTADYPAATLADSIAAATGAAAACSNASANVVYIPGGNYSVTTPVEVGSYVILRGEDAGSARPRTRLQFPDREYMGLQCTPPCIAVGVVNLDLDGGPIAIGPPPLGVNDTFALVFGNTLTNIAYKYPSGPGGSTTGNEWPYRFAHAISVEHAPNALIGNNVIAPATAARNVTVSFIGTRGAANFTGSLPFPYDNRYGIQLTTPSNSTSVNMSIDSNYVYQNGRIGIQWSSVDTDVTQRGSGVRVLYNHVEVAANTTCYSVEGIHLTTGSDTNENRGYDQAGSGSYIYGNTGHIHRQQAAFTAYETVDGEGILQQPQDGDDGYRNVWDSNDLRGGTSGYMAYYGLNAVVNNTITNCTVIASEGIGLLKPMPGLQLAGNECSGNTPPCTGMQ